MTTAQPLNHPHQASDRSRRIVIAIIAALAVASLVIVSSSSAASAHDGHRATEAQRTDRDTDEAKTTQTPTKTVEAPTRTSARARTAQLAIDQFHLARINDVDVAVFDQRHRGSGDLAIAGGRGQANPLNVDCYVDFDDDLTIQYHAPGGAENTFMTGHWFQKCFESSYPAVAVKYLNYGHFHLGYEDPRIGPCAGSQVDWGRKAEPFPSDEDEISDWVLAECVSDIDPVTEPRSGISAHLPGHRGKIVAYDGDGHRPFQLRTLEVVSGEVEVCHLPPGPIVVANGGGSPWKCTVWGVGYWDMSDHVPNTMQVQFEFLTNGEIDNVGVDLL